MRFVDQLLDLNDRIRNVQLRIDGEVESSERQGLPVRVTAEDDIRDETLASPNALVLGQGSAMRVRAGTRPVVIRRGSVWRIAMACRGGEVSVEVDIGADPIEVAAQVADVLVRAGR